MESGYKVCPKCKVRHSTLVRHKCFTPEKQKDKPEFDNPPPGDGDPGDGGGGGTGDKSEGEGEGQSQGEGQGQGDGEGEGDGEGDAEGEGEGQGEGQGEGEGEGEGSAPEEEIPPAAVVVTVLKFAALTARGCTAMIKVELGEDGMEVYGYNGDEYEAALIPWGEFEKRSTIDGEYYVKEIIDAVDEKLSGKREPEEEAEDDGWIDWTGGDCPVPGGTNVEVRLRKPYSDGPNTGPADVYIWRRDGDDADIVAYRVID